MIGSIRNINFKGNFNGFAKNLNIQNLKNSIPFGAIMPEYLNEALQGIKKDEFQIVTPRNIDAEFERNEKLKQETPNDFLEWAQETDFIKTGLKEALKPENRIGEGFEHGVYNIPGNDDYVLRIKRDFYLITQDIDYSDYGAQDTRDMELQGNIGQQVAILRENDRKNEALLNHPVVEVLKKQKGYANANPSPNALVYGDTDIVREGVLPYEHPDRKKHFAKCMEVLANMPDETYDKLIDDLLLAGEAGYKFDCLNSNNFLIDEENQSINLIDMQTTTKPHKDRFGNTLYALINLEFFDEYQRKSSGYVPENPDEEFNTFNNMLTILNKYTNAMKRKLQKYNTNSYYFHLLLNSLLASYWLKTRDFDEKCDKLREMDVLYDPNYQAKEESRVRNQLPTKSLLF